MHYHTATINIRTSSPIQFIDITDDVRKAVEKSGVMDGVVNIYSNHTTAAVKVNERCDRLQKDMESFLSGLVPRVRDYAHNEHTVDGRGNAHSHLMSLLLNASESIPVAGGEMQLGAWQSIFFIELDGPRGTREARVTVMGL